MGPFSTSILPNKYSIIFPLSRNDCDCSRIYVCADFYSDHVLTKYFLMRLIYIDCQLHCNSSCSKQTSGNMFEEKLEAILPIQFV